jgi:uncharacterized OB-fold protein
VANGLTELIEGETGLAAGEAQPVSEELSLQASCHGNRNYNDSSRSREEPAMLKSTIFNSFDILCTHQPVECDDRRRFDVGDRPDSNRRPKARLDMPKQSPVPGEVDRPFWDACNEEKLIVQHCDACDSFQHPPDTECYWCGAPGDRLSWRQINGTGTIYSYSVVHDTPISVLQGDLPYNVAVIDLDEAPGINMISHLHDVPISQVPIGAPVTLFFESTPGSGQKIPQWQVAEGRA